MQISSVLLLLLLLLSGCNSPQPPLQPVESIELTFQQLSSEELELFYRDFGIPDTLRPWLMEENFLRMSVKNNIYDSLRLPLAKFGKNLVYRSDVVVKYRVEHDSLIGMSSSIRCFGKADSIVCLGKGRSANVYFEGRCSDQHSVYEYNFSFYTDSAGQEKNPQFKQFPCGNVLPKKQR